MVLKTRKALPKFRLFKKFKIDFFNSFSKSSRVSRKYLKFYISKKRRYGFWHAKQTKSYIFCEYLDERATELFYTKHPQIVKQFTLFQSKIWYKYSFLVKKLVQSIVISHNVRSSLSEKLLFNPVKVSSCFITPTSYRFGSLYNFKNK